MDILEVYNNGIEEVDDSIKIARYMSYEKLEKLTKGKMFFTNCEKFQDDYERKTIAYAKYKNQLAYDITKKIQKSLNEKCIAYASCWTKYSGEDAALWKIYDSSKNGCCIITTVGKLKEEINKYNKNILIGEVLYEKEGGVGVPWIDIQDVASNYVAFEYIKIAPYKYENEIRAIFFRKRKAIEKGKPIEKGMEIDIDFKSLVDELYLSPFATKDNNDKTRELLSKVITSSIIKESRLSESKK